MTEDRALKATPSELVSAVAHELQAPIAAVRASSAALRSDAELDATTRDRLLAVISSAAEQLARLAEDLLLAGHLGDPTFRVNLRPCDAREVVSSAIAAVQIAAPSAGEVVLSAPRDLRPVLADRDRLEQVIANVVGNALKHGGRAAPIGVELEEAGSAVRISVTDRGPGIPAAERERVFERFQRGPTDAPGSGLGLYIARELMTEMGGDVRIEPDALEGTTFVVLIPVAD